MSTQTPIEVAVMPFKSEAVERAGAQASAFAERCLKLLADADWNLDVVAPRADSLRSPGSYKADKARRAMFLNFAHEPRAWSERRYHHGTREAGPCIVCRCDELIARYVEMARVSAAEHYDAFVEKLVGKVGAHTGAVLTGGWVWDGAVLAVTKEGGIERWKTQCILNVSVLGKFFNQWPTRKLK